MHMRGMRQHGDEGGSLIGAMSQSKCGTGRRQEEQQAGGRVLVEGAPPVGPAARFAELPIIARVSAGVLLLGAALFAFQRLRGSGSGCSAACPV